MKIEPMKQPCAPAALGVQAPCCQSSRCASGTCTQFSGDICVEDDMGTNIVYETYSAEETIRLARKIAHNLHPGSVCALIGDLGVGKTVFAQGIAEGLGICEPICSPTFTIVQEYYGGRMPFYHFDVYRIAEPEEMEEIGYEDYFYGDGFTMVEWADLIADLMPAQYQKITIEKNLEKGFQYRRITVEEVVCGNSEDI